MVLMSKEEMKNDIKKQLANEHTALSIDYPTFEEFSKPILSEDSFHTSRISLIYKTKDNKKVNITIHYAPNKVLQVRARAQKEDHKGYNHVEKIIEKVMGRDFKYPATRALSAIKLNSP